METGFWVNIVLINKVLFKGSPRGQAGAGLPLFSSQFLCVGGGRAADVGGGIGGEGGAPCLGVHVCCVCVNLAVSGCVYSCVPARVVRLCVCVSVWVRGMLGPVCIGR